MNRNLKVLFIGVICAVIAFFFFDHPLGMWFHQKPVSGDLRTLINCGEIFGHGFGPFLAALMIYVLDRANRRHIPRVVTCATVCGLAAALMKVFVSRVRPRAFDFSRAIGESFLGPAWLHEMSSRYQSFPSAHTATAVGLALALSRLYPQGRLLFAGFAVLVALQRMTTGSHYLSDTIIGATLAILVAGGFLRTGPVARWFDRQAGGNEERS